MAPLPDYVAGTITLTNNSTAFTGAGTGWLAAGFREGDTILGIEDNPGVVYVVESVTDNDSGTLTQPWDGPTGTYTYRMRYLSDGQRVTAQARQLIEMLGNGNLQAVAGLDGSGGDKVPYFSGPGSMATTDLTAFSRSMLGSADAAAARTLINALAVGDYGWGGTAVPVINSGSWDDVTAGGFYTVTGAVTNGPVALTCNAIVIPNDASGGRAAQIAMQVNSDAIWRRYQYDGAWSPWRLIYNQGNILGTVSQSAGLPTGAIAERGSNANGSYVRFADGLQICMHTITVATAGTSAAANGAWNYPAAFAVAPFGMIDATLFSGNWSPDLRNNLQAAGTNGVGTSSAQFQYRLDSPQNVTISNVGVSAVGRWF